VRSTSVSVLRFDAYLLSLTPRFSEVCQRREGSNRFSGFLGEETVEAVM
jgi:hypothetical protein